MSAATSENTGTRSARSSGRTMGKRLRPWGRGVLISFLAAIFGFPLYWTITMSFKSLDEWNPPGKVYWVPKDWTLDNYKDTFGLTSKDQSFFSATSESAIPYIEHSLIAAVGGTILAMLIGVFAAYGIARFRAGGRMLPFQILQLRMFPPVAIIIPLFFMWVYLGLWNSIWGLIILYGAVTFPFVVWLMRSFFQETPREVGEAAIVDGCTQWGAFFKAVLPLAKGGLAATALFVFILCWSDFLIALVMTQNGGPVTAPVFLQSLQGGSSGQKYGPQAALAVILILPPAVFGLSIQRYLVRGLTFGAVKR